MSPALLEVEALGVAYRGRRRERVRAVDGVSFAVARGEAVGLVGESGSGKSTIARAIMGLAPVAAGAVRFLGADITRLSFRERRGLYRHVQLVFQDPYGSLNPARTVGQALAEPVEALGRADRSATRARVLAMLERVQLPPEAADRYPHEFSGGQRQRICIGRALMLDPQLLICDEAVSALDLSVQAQILNLLRDLQAASDLSLLFISHDLDVVRHMCDRTVVLYRGRVMEVGDTSPVAAAPAHPYTQALLEAAPVPDPRRQRERRAQHAAAASAGEARQMPADDGCVFAPRCPYAVASCRAHPPALRPAEDGGLVACHRHPEWRDELVLAAPSEPRRRKAAHP